MRDKVIALAAVASAGVAIAVGLTIGALGGAFDDTDQTVRPPALKSDNLSSVEMSPSSTIVVVPPSPTWQVAVPTTPRPTTTRPTTTTPDRSETTTRGSRRTTGADRTTTTSEDEDESTDETTTEEPGSGR